MSTRQLQTPKQTRANFEQASDKVNTMLSDVQRTDMVDVQKYLESRFQLKSKLVGMMPLGARPLMRQTEVERYMSSDRGFKAIGGRVHLRRKAAARSKLGTGLYL